MKIKLHDKFFVPYIKETEISERISAMANQLTKDYKDTVPVFVSLLNGSYWFTTDLLKDFFGDCEVSFVKYKSYEGMQSTGNITQSIGLDINIEGKDVIIVEDIIDTGATLHHFLEEISRLKPKSLRIATLLLKPNALQFPITADYIGFSIPNDFIVGYGLDYNGLGRNYKDIYVVEN